MLAMKKILILIGILLVFFITGSFWWSSGLRPANSADKTLKVFVVQKGAGLKEISSSLKQENLIRDPIVFFLFIRMQGLDGKLQAGDFRLSPSQSAQDIAKTLTHGTLDIWITIPEGYRTEEIAQILQEKIPTYQANWVTSLKIHEGYLFPDTYLFPNDTNIDTIISIMNNNFEKKYLQAASNQTTKLKKSDVVILASIVQREGKSANEMKTIASVLENRLSLGMALQADSTVQYIMGYAASQKTWWPTPGPRDIKIQSDYNTYLAPGLPPTPIANPGLDALTAVLNPPNTNYLYYYTDSKGITHFATTLDEQNKNIQKFQ